MNTKKILQSSRYESIEGCAEGATETHFEESHQSAI
jgi:hypothetical protein